MDVFAAVADSTRRSVLRLLRDRERAAGDLALAFPALSQPAVSRHLRVLREAGLVNVRVDEQRRLYSLRTEGLREIATWLDTLRHFWRDELDALTRHLDATAAASPPVRAPSAMTTRPKPKTNASNATRATNSTKVRRRR